MRKNRKTKIVPLEDRIVLDAAVASAVASAVAHAVTPSVIMVDANAHGNVHDGSSWATAYTNVQDALNKAAQTPGGDQIWVAQGNYKPTQIYSPDGVTGGAVGSSASNMKTFNLPSDVAIYGGFKSGAHSLSERNPGKYVTVFNGDLAGNDINNPNDPGYAASKADNAWHVVTAGNDVSHTGVTALIDGVTIMNGYASGPEGSPFFSPVVANNYYAGGGMYINFDSHITLNNVTFDHNAAIGANGTGDGGGIFSNNSDFLIKNSTFTNNSAYTRAGAVEGWSTYDTKAHSMVITDSVFKNNTAVIFGGAVVGEGTFPSAGSSMTISNSVFTHNVANEGGAIVVDSLNVNVDHSIFNNNVGIVNGGAIAETNVVDTLATGPINFTTTITDSVFTGNTALGDRAAWTFMTNFFAPLGLNIQFALGGGALTNYMHGNMVVDRSLFVDNTSINSDGGAIVSGSGYTTAGSFLVAAGVNTSVTNSIFIDNEAKGGNGGAIAAVSDVGYVAPPSLEASVTTIKGNLFVNNSAKNGGAVAVIDATAIIDHNILVKSNDAHGLGDRIYASGSVVNGIDSSSSAALKSQLQHSNLMGLLDRDDLYLI